MYWRDPAAGGCLDASSIGIRTSIRPRPDRCRTGIDFTSAYLVDVTVDSGGLS